MVIIVQIQKTDGTYQSGTAPSEVQALAASINDTLFGVFDPSVKQTAACAGLFILINLFFPFFFRCSLRKEGEEKKTTTILIIREPPQDYGRAARTTILGYHMM